MENSDVLALASYPTYDPAKYYSDYNSILNTDGNPLRNRATTGTYAPGSTFKPCTAVAALETGAVSLTGESELPRPLVLPQYPRLHQVCRLSRPAWQGETSPRLWRSPATASSARWATGWASTPSVSMPPPSAWAKAPASSWARETGVLAGPEHSAAVNQMWYGGNTVQAAIGQSDHLFTPLQLASYIATLVRGGTRYDAHLLKSVTAYDGSEILYEHEPEVLSEVEISASTLSAVKEGMYSLTTSGSLARYFKGCIVSAGAKTGTAQINENTTNNGVFVCFAPYEDPEIALAIVIERGGQRQRPWPPLLWRSSTPTSLTAISAPL